MEVVYVQMVSMNNKNDFKFFGGGVRGEGEQYEIFLKRKL